MPDQPEDPLHYDMKIPPENPRLKRKVETGSAEESGKEINKSEANNSQDTASETQPESSQDN